MAKSPSVKLCGAGGTELSQSGCFSLELDIYGRKQFHNWLFIDQLQVPCILGMDFLSKLGAIIETNTNTISFSSVPRKPPRKLNINLTNCNL